MVFKYASRISIGCWEQRELAFLREIVLEICEFVILKD